MPDALAAHPLGDAQFALEENRFLAQIHSSPEDIVPLLRKFWGERRHGDYTPNLVPLTSVLGRFLFYEDMSQIGRRTWSILMSSGLPDLYQEMIMDKDFLTEYPRWILQVLSGLVAVTRQCRNLKDAALANRILVKSHSVWKSLWDRRDALYPGPNRWITIQRGIIGFHRLVTEKIVLLVVSMTELYMWRNRMTDWFKTHIRHVSFYCWFHHDLNDVEMLSPTPGLALSAMSVQMSLSSIESDDFASDFGKEMIRIFGAQSLLNRFEQDFKNPTVEDSGHGLRISIIADFGRHEEMQAVLGLRTYFNSIVNVLRGMKQRQCEKEWDVWSLSCHILKIITLNIDKFITPGLISSVRGDDIFYMMSRGVTFCAQDPDHTRKFCLSFE
ncbi:hypothetical protein OF83DRAFT_251317 [Amylostereum chailletii]|nr:hypothetical protein OF83DRAFT_251317 [Amylostereum chailletii]